MNQCIDTSLSAPPGDPTMTSPDLLTPGTLPHLSNSEIRLSGSSSSSSSTGSNTALDASQLASLASSGMSSRPLRQESKSGSVHSLLTSSLAAVKQQDDDRQASHAHASSSTPDTRSAPEHSFESLTTGQPTSLGMEHRVNAPAQQGKTSQSLQQIAQGNHSRLQALSEGSNRKQPGLLSPFSDTSVPGVPGARPRSDGQEAYRWQGSSNVSTQENRQGNCQVKDITPGIGNGSHSAQGSRQGDSQARDTMPGNGSDEECGQDHVQQGSDLQQLLVSSRQHVTAAAADIRDSIISSLSPNR